MICTKSFQGKTIQASDGHIGHVEDVYFDDQEWRIRYLAVKTGKWLPGRTVLLASQSITECWHGKAGVPVTLTRDQVKSKEAPVANDPHLCCTHDVLGYSLRAADGDIGRLDDLIINDENCSIRFLIVKIERRLGARKVLIRPSSITRIDRVEKKLITNLSCREIETSPECEHANC